MSEFQWYRFEQLTSMQLYRVLMLRQQVFIIEQQSIYVDIDGQDLLSWHLLLSENTVIVGYLRLREEAEQVKIERVVLDQDYRKKGLGQGLMTAAMHQYARLYGNKCYPLMLSAQVSAREFYTRFGFVAQGQTYDDGGIEHIDMRYTPFIGS